MVLSHQQHKGRPLILVPLQGMSYSSRFAGKFRLDLQGQTSCSFCRASLTFMGWVYPLPRPRALGADDPHLCDVPRLWVYPPPPRPRALGPMTHISVMYPDGGLPSMLDAASRKNVSSLCFLDLI